MTLLPPQCPLTGDFHFSRFIKTNASSRLEMKSCLLSNISECSIASESKNFIMTIYNPLSRPVNYYARVPVFGGEYSVLDPKGNVVPYQVSTISLGFPPKSSSNHSCFPSAGTNPTSGESDSGKEIRDGFRDCVQGGSAAAPRLSLVLRIQTERIRRRGKFHGRRSLRRGRTLTSITVGESN